MENEISEGHQKYSYEDYYEILRKISHTIRSYKAQASKRARVNAIWDGIISYPIKLLLGSSVSGGAIDAIGNLRSDQKWVSYMRTVFEVLAIILLTTKDFGQFEKQKQKYNQAAALLSSFNIILTNQMRIKRGYEGNREDIIKEITETFEGIKNSNKIIQDIEMMETEDSLNGISRASSYDHKKSSFEDAKSVQDDRSSSEDNDTELIEMERGERQKISMTSARRQSMNTALINDMMQRMT